jgi:hypothetical protein
VQITAHSVQDAPGDKHRDMRRSSFGGQVGWEVAPMVPRSIVVLHANPSSVKAS